MVPSLIVGSYASIAIIGSEWEPKLRRQSRERTVQEVIDCLSIGDLAPTESRGDGSQNCLYDMSIVGNA